MEQIAMKSNSLEGAVDEQGLTLLDFWAPWCVLSEIMDPLVEDLAEKYRGRLNVVRVNVDENADLAARYRVRNVPTLDLVEGGKLIDEFVGMVSRTTVEEAIERRLV